MIKRLFKGVDEDPALEDVICSKPDVDQSSVSSCCMTGRSLVFTFWMDELLTNRN